MNANSILKSDETCQVAVIGGGLVGAATDDGYLASLVGLQYRIGVHPRGPKIIRRATKCFSGGTISSASKPRPRA